MAYNYGHSYADEMAYYREHSQHNWESMPPELWHWQATDELRIAL